MSDRRLDGAVKLISLGLIALISVVVVRAAAAGDDGRVTLPAWPQARDRVSDAQGCVEPTDIMRKDHMNFLLHQRDDTVHQGIRTKRHSLTGCINCHVSVEQSGKPIPINAPGQFCQSCHVYAGVKMDCFGCHATMPAETGSSVHGDLRSLLITRVLKDRKVMDMLLANVGASGRVP